MSTRVINWIPCDERMPEDLKVVLVYMPRTGIKDAYCWDGEWFNCAWVSHWADLDDMPRPKVKVDENEFVEVTANMDSGGTR